MRSFIVTLMALVPLLAAVIRADDSDRLLSIDHYVKVRSTVPSLTGQTTEIYVRERVQAGTHGQTLPAVELSRQRFEIGEGEP